MIQALSPTTLENSDCRRDGVDVSFNMEEHATAGFRQRGLKYWCRHKNSGNVHHGVTPMKSPSDDHTALDESSVLYIVRFYAAFREFLNALEYARDLDTSPWEFAVELSCLRHLKLSRNDLRWLVAMGLVSHAIETTSASDAVRSFKRPARLTFRRETCFVLTPKGEAASRAIWGGDDHLAECGELRSQVDSSLPSAVPPNNPPAPKWDRDRQELRVGTVVVKRFRVPAASQEAILSAFEEEAWPSRIDDPLPPRSDQSPKRRLQETIKSLNRNQKQPLIRFLGDGSARGVLWEYCGENERLSFSKSGVSLFGVR